MCTCKTRIRARIEIFIHLFGKLFGEKNLRRTGGSLWERYLQL